MVKSELFPDHCFCVVSTVKPVTACVPVNPCRYCFRAAFQLQQMRDRNMALHIPSLADMAGEAVQDDKVRFSPSTPRKKVYEYLLGKRKMLIFQEPAFFKDIADESKFFSTESRSRLLASRNTPQFPTEVEMAASSAQNASLRHIISQRGLSRAGRSDQQDRLARLVTLHRSVHRMPDFRSQGRYSPRPFRIPYAFLQTALLHPILVNMDTLY